MNISENSASKFGYLVLHSCDILNHMFRTHLCGYDLNLTYPPDGKLPSIADPNPAQASKPATDREIFQGHFKRTLSTLANGIEAHYDAKSRLPVIPSQSQIEAHEIKKQAWVREITRTTHSSMITRDLSGRTNGTIDPYYGCFLVDELMDYALNFSLPWSESGMF
jgi:carboxypeptidase D